jgi:hypothetical protein
MSAIATKLASRMGRIVAQMISTRQAEARLWDNHVSCNSGEVPSKSFKVTEAADVVAGLVVDGLFVDGLFVVWGMLWGESISCREYCLQT